VGVAELLRRPGSRRRVRIAAPLPELALSTTAVPAGAEVVFDGVVDSVFDGSLTAVGTVTAPWTGECRRCLRPVEGEIEAEVSEVFSRDAVEGETYPIDGDHVDLAPVVHDAVLLALPLAPLCSDDCRGPEPDDYPVTVEDVRHGGGDVQPPRDPRWAALDDLHFDP
jgi:uncharacterized protein